MLRPAPHSSTSCVLLIGCLSTVLACGGQEPGVPDGIASAVDGSPGPDPDARPASGPDGSASETCTTDWCQKQGGPLISFTTDIAFSPSGFPWVAANGVYELTASGWKHHDLSWEDLFEIQDDILDVHVTGEGDVWVVGSGYLGRYDGSTWTELSATAPQAVWGATNDDVWIFSHKGIQHWNGSEITLHSGSTLSGYTGAWGRAADDIYALGYTNDDGYISGQIEHWDGESWQSLSEGPLGRIEAIFVDDAGMWAMNDGFSQDLYRKTTGDWEKVEELDHEQLQHFYARSSNQVWAVGNDGRAWYWDGVTWTQTTTGTSSDLFLVGGVDDRVMAIGEYSTLTWIEE